MDLILSYLAEHRVVIGKFFLNMTFFAMSVVDKIDLAIRVSSFLAGMILTGVLIYRAILDIRIKKKALKKDGKGT